MKLLLNDKEIAHFLTNQFDYLARLKEVPYLENETGRHIMDYIRKRNKFIKLAREYDPNPVYKPTDGEKKKFAKKIIKAVEGDLREYRKMCNDRLHSLYESNFNAIHKNIDYVIDKIGLETIFKLYKKSEYKNFVKGTGLSINKKADFMRRMDFTDYTQDAVIRNTVGNEELLVTKIDKGYPMWFIDSGYTNFLEPNKKWHRLVRNHLHYGDYFDAPVDRLGNFKTFPQQWRQDGEYIYVIEPGPFAAAIFHADLKKWKYDVEAELRKYTDKPIKFREKAPKRERTNLYEELCNEDYHCIVSINSNAATEAIWAGVPAITLDRHVTNPVTVNKLSDVNNLYRGNLANWLAYLSYNQFTKEELMNGYAHKMVVKYNV